MKKKERVPKVDVWVVAPRDFQSRVPIRRFATLADVEAYKGKHLERMVVTQARGSARDLFRWGLGPAPHSYKAPKRSTRPRRVHPPICPSCGAHWYGPGRPRKDGSRNVVPQPTDWADYDGPDPSSLRPRASQAPASDLEDRPDLAGLYDPRLHDELPDDF